MKTVLAVVVLGALLQQWDPGSFLLAQNTRGPVMLGTAIHVPEATAGSAFSDLLAVGLENRIPIGLVVGMLPTLACVESP
jgi:hypothetical protein